MARDVHTENEDEIPPDHTFVAGMVIQPPQADQIKDTLHNPLPVNKFCIFCKKIPCNLYYIHVISQSLPELHSIHPEPHGIYPEPLLYQ